MNYCRQCGKEMKIGFSKRTVFCSDECCKAYYRKNKYRYCEVCGKLLTGKQRKFCDECKAKAKSNREYLYHKDQYKKPKAEEKPKAKRGRPKKVLSASEIEKIARAEGITYGKCVAKYGY